MLHVIASGFTERIRVLLPAGATAVVLGLEISNYYLQTSGQRWLTGAGVAVAVTSSVLMILAVLWKHRSEAEWWLFASGLACFSAGALTNFIYTEFYGAFPFPGPADIAFLLIYPIIFAGLLALRHSLNINVTVPDFLMSAIVTAFVFFQLGYPVFTGPSSIFRVPLLIQAFLLVYPVFDAMILCATICLIISMSHSSVPAAYWMIMAGIAGLLTSDLIFAYEFLNFSWYQPSAVDIGWMTWFSSWALAALLPQARESSG